MSDRASMEIIDPQVLDARVTAGLLLPLAAGPAIIDCGDWRPPTPPLQAERAKRHGHAGAVPGRYLGAAGGLALTELVAWAVETDEQTVRGFMDELRAEAIAERAAGIAAEIHDAYGIEVTQHSDHASEGSEVAISTDPKQDHPLGCKLLTYMGLVLNGSAGDEAIREARDTASLVGVDLPISDVRDGALILSTVITPDLSIGRRELRQANTKVPGHTPVAILNSRPETSASPAMVMDLAGYRSDAETHVHVGTPRYHHTPGLASLLAGLDADPEYDTGLDKNLLTAAALVLGCATRAALSRVSQTPLSVEVIPAEYAVGVRR